MHSIPLSSFTPFPAYMHEKTGQKRFFYTFEHYKI